MGVLDNFFQQAQDAASGGLAVVGKCTATATGSGIGNLSAKGDLAFHPFIPKHPPFPSPPSFSGKIGKSFGDNNFELFVLLARQNVFEPKIPGEYEFVVEGANIGSQVSLNQVSDPVPGFSALSETELQFVQTTDGITLTITITIP